MYVFSKSVVLNRGAAAHEGAVNRSLGCRQILDFLIIWWNSLCNLSMISRKGALKVKIEFYQSKGAAKSFYSKRVP